MTGLRHRDDILFDAEKHEYWLSDGPFGERRQLMGVTSLMAKHGLSPDYSGVPEDTLERARERGSEVHALLEAYDNGLAAAAPEGLERYLKDYKAMNLNAIASEYLVSDGEIVASMIDKVLETDEGIALADIKTTARLHEKSVAWQLSIYKYLFELQNPGVKAAALYAIHLPAKGKSKLVELRPVPEEDVRSLLECEALGVIYQPEQEPGADAVLSESERAEVSSAYLTIAAAKEMIKAAEERVAEYQKRLIDWMEENRLEDLEIEGGTLHLRKAGQRVSVDSARLKDKYPDIYDDCKKSSEVAASLTFKRAK